MSTRGLFGFVIDGQIKANYNHMDSYPEGWGKELAEQVVAGFDADAVRKIQLIDPEDPKASEIQDGGANLAKAVARGVMVDESNFANDSLWCEWGYLVNLDEGKLEVYRGMNDHGHRVGRFADVTNYEYEPWDGTKYAPIALVGSFEIDETLPQRIESFGRMEREARNAAYEADPKARPDTYLVAKQFADGLVAASGDHVPGLGSGPEVSPQTGPLRGKTSPSSTPGSFAPKNQAPSSADFPPFGS